MQIFWVNMIVRPFIKYHPFLQYNKVVELKNTFNELLKEVAGKYDCNEIIESNLSLHEELLDSFGNLTFKGKKAFWRDIDAKLRNLLLHKSLQTHSNEGVGDTKCDTSQPADKRVHSKQHH